MSDEAMALERLLLRAWELEGYFGQARVRVQRDGNWPELDAVAFHAVDRVLRIGEVKARYHPRWVTPLDEKGWNDSLQHWLGFTAALRALYPGGRGGEAMLNGLPRWGDWERVEVWFVVNGWNPGSPDALAAHAGRIAERIRDDWGYSQTKPAALRALEVRIVSTFDVIVELIENVDAHIASGRGARFGDPFLDAIRELLRYMRPDLAHVPVDAAGARCGTLKHPFEQRVRRESAARIVAALGIDDLFDLKVAP
jgi:hypothetical protein